MPFVELKALGQDAINLYAEIRGTGSRLLYISGTGSDLRKAPNIFESPLAEHFEILAYDHRGLGQSDKPDIPYSMQMYGDDVAALLDAVGWEQALVMGTSFGGMVAQELALGHPAKVSKLVLACTSSGGAGGASYPLHELADLTPEERARAMIPLADTRCDEAWQTANAQVFNAMLTWSIENGRFAADEPGHALGARRQLEARAGHNTYDRLPQLTMPVYVCGGHHDGIASPDNLQALAAQIPHVELEFFEGGHGFLMQDQGAYQSIIRFLLG
ncbi:MAG: alpha/beta hydrolase [Chloroflexota bacterium]